MPKFNINHIESLNNGSKKKDNKWFKPVSGENPIRIIESDSDIPPMVVGYKHFNVGPNRHSYWCRKTSLDGSGQKDWNEACPVCDRVSALYDSGDEVDRKVASSMKAAQRILLNVVELNDKEKGVRAFECSKTLWEIMTKYWTSKKYGNLADAKEGYDFIIKKEGPNNRPNYDKSFAADDATPIQDKKWPSTMINLLDELSVKSYDFMKAILDGEEPVEEKAPKEETPKEKTPAVESSGEEPVTEEEDTPPFDVDEKETPKPKSKKKKKKAAKPPCFGEYDEDDTECTDECKWAELCEDEDGETSDDKALESEILDEMKSI